MNQRASHAVAVISLVLAAVCAVGWISTLRQQQALQSAREQLIPGEDTTVHFNGRIVFGEPLDTSKWNAGDWRRYNAYRSRFDHSTDTMTDRQLEQDAVKKMVDYAHAHTPAR